MLNSTTEATLSHNEVDHMATATVDSTKASRKKAGGGGVGEEYEGETRTIAAKDLPTNLSYQYNSRMPSRTSKPYKDMMQTLQHEPELFRMQNGGITIANSQYILDGGHTYLAIMDAKKAGWDLSKVKVKVGFEEGLSPAEMVKSSMGHNNKKAAPIAGQKELAGEWDDIKAALSKKYADLYQFKPNTKTGDYFDVDFLVALLHGWWPGSNKVDRVYSTKGILVKLFTKDKYKPVVGRINEAIEFWSLVAKTIGALPEKELTKLKGIRKPGRMLLPNGEYLDAKIPEAYIWLMYCAAGKLLNEQAEWTKDPSALFLKSFKGMWKQLVEDYRKYGQDPSQLGKQPDAYMRQIVALL